ncbi:MAG: hypothetical protein LJE70_21120, partial [Chromatiaceae bacterium]|nr:hypothetical protein [Chromatiaceae bacterium]
MRGVKVLLLGALVFSNAWATRFKIEISPEVPDDIRGGAVDANVVQAARFAWQEFIALNWPADTTNEQRDVPDENATFGDPSFDGPLVWHTFRHKVETFPGTGIPHGYVDKPSQDFGYNSLPPVYTYAEEFGENGDIPPCPGQKAVPNPALINLDEVSQIGLDTMFAGVAPDDTAPEINSFPQVLRFLAKTNKTYYEYVVDGNALITGGDPLYTHPTPCPTDFNDPGYFHTYCVAQRNFTKVSGGGGFPDTIQSYFVDFPAGTILAKGAFRPLTQEEMDSGRFYTTRVRYYEDDGVDSEPGDLCYREAVWGMVGLHIIHKTPTAPNFVFATFEQVDNLLTEDGQPV